MQTYIFLNYIYIYIILIIFISIIFYLKSSLAKNYLMSTLLHTKFNFLLNCGLLVRAYQLLPINFGHP
jgi:hypothetical protein